MMTTDDLFTSFPTEEPEPEPTTSHTRSLVEWVVVVAGAICVALIIKTYVMQAFFIPSESMQATLEKGDRVLVNKLSYRMHAVNRQDVVVFERPAGAPDEVKDLIKRVIALPGEKVVIKNTKVYINDVPLPEQSYLPPGTVTDGIQGKPAPANFPHVCSDVDPCIIPEHSYWVMGDNRANSQDSRYFGPISEEMIVGRAFVVVWPPSRLGGL